MGFRAFLGWGFGALRVWGLWLFWGWGHKAFLGWGLRAQERLFTRILQRVGASPRLRAQNQKGSRSFDRARAPQSRERCLRPPRPDRPWSQPWSSSGPLAADGIPKTRLGEHLQVNVSLSYSVRTTGILLYNILGPVGSGVGHLKLKVPRCW